MKYRFSGKGGGVLNDRGWSTWQEWDVVANDDLGNRNGWAFSCGCGFAGYSHCAQGSLARMVSVKICPSYLGE